MWRSMSPPFASIYFFKSDLFKHSGNRHTRNNPTEFPAIVIQFKFNLDLSALEYFCFEQPSLNCLKKANFLAHMISG